MKTETTDTCSFCGKHKDAVAKLIVGTEVAICNECDRRFDLWNEDDAAEFYFGHDCEN